MVGHTGPYMTEEWGPEASLAGIANQRFPLKSVAGKTFSAFPVRAQPAILRIWPMMQEIMLIGTITSISHYG